MVPLNEWLKKLSQDNAMNSPIWSKLATFAAALMMNGLIIAGVNYLFNHEVHQPIAEIDIAAMALAQTNDNGLRDGLSG
jgi:hypothetical protein